MTTTTEFEHEKYRATSKKFIVLQITSILFAVPAVYAFQNNLYFYAIISLFTGIISFVGDETWIHFMPIYAKLSGLLYTGSGILYVPFGFPTFVFYLGVVLLVYFYILSCYDFPSGSWIKFHAMFHLTSIFVKLYILWYMKQMFYDIQHYCTTNMQPSIYSVNYC